ncbi:MAG: hypothetical protein ABSF67_06915 [Roseiarcus sp.]|jgi:hypothetical protein
MKAPSAPPPLGTSWDFTLPDKLKLAIADSLVAFARLETLSLETVWIFEDATLAEKKALARDWVTANFRKIKRVVKKLPGAETDKIWPTLEKLAQERNLIAHGFWAVDSSGRPVVMSHKFLESDDYVTAEFFDYTRFDYFITRAEHLVKTFQQFKTMLDSLSKDQRIAAGLTLPKNVRPAIWRRLGTYFRKLWVCLRTFD